MSFLQIVLKPLNELFNIVFNYDIDINTYTLIIFFFQFWYLIHFFTWS